MRKYDFLRLNLAHSSVYDQNSKQGFIVIGSSNIEYVKKFVDELEGKIKNYFPKVDVKFSKDSKRSSSLGHNAWLPISPITYDGNDENKIHHDDLSYFLMGLAIEDNWLPNHEDTFGTWFIKYYE